MINLSDYYNHSKFMASVQEGNNLVNNTDFKKYYNQRMQAMHDFKINDIVEDNTTHAILKIIDIDKDILIVSKVNKRGKISEVTSFINPLHVTKIK